MRVQIQDKIATGAFYTIAVLITIILGSILAFIFIKGIGGISLDFLTSESENMRAGGGIGPQLFNSFYLLFLTMFITIPIGVGGGIYMSEFAKDNFFTNFARLVIEVLSSLPSIVVGLFGLLILVQKLGLGFSIISGAIALTIFNLPLMIRITEQSLQTVPRNQKEVSLAMGVTHFDTIIYVMLPIALPSITTGIILAAGRVFGEAAALMYTAGMSAPQLNVQNALNPFRPAETLAVHIWKVNAEGLAPDSMQIVASASLVLVAGVLLFNILSRILGKKLQRKLSGN